jgi:hypothetical protein
MVVCVVLCMSQLAIQACMGSVVRGVNVLGCGHTAKHLRIDHTNEGNSPGEDDWTVVNDSCGVSQSLHGSTMFYQVQRPTSAQVIEARFNQCWEGLKAYHQGIERTGELPLGTCEEVQEEHSEEVVFERDCSPVSRAWKLRFGSCVIRPSLHPGSTQHCAIILPFLLSNFLCAYHLVNSTYVLLSHTSYSSFRSHDTEQLLG